VDLVFLLPTRVNLSFMWNLGSLLGFILLIQIIRGFFFDFLL